MKVYYDVLSSFSKNGTGGNKAAVVVNNNLRRIEKKYIAKEIGFSETVFVEDSKIADLKLNYFTPEEEVNLCGHGTIATIFNLYKKKSIIKNELKIETNIGVLTILIEDKNEKVSVFMEQGTPIFMDLIPKEKLLKCFSLKKEDMMEDYEAQIISTGLKDIIVPIKSYEILMKMNPNYEEIKRISKEYNVVGMHCFTFETINNCDAHTRNFAPLYGINEESATGTSNCALASYIFKNLNNKDKNNYNFVFEQGYILNNPSEIVVKLDTNENDINKIFVGGEVYFIETKNLNI